MIRYLSSLCSDNECIFDLIVMKWMYICIYVPELYNYLNIWTNCAVTKIGNQLLVHCSYVVTCTGGNSPHFGYLSDVTLYYTTAYVHCNNRGVINQIKLLIILALLALKRILEYSLEINI